MKYKGWFQQFDGKEFWVYGDLIKRESGNLELTDGQTFWTVDEVELIEEGEE